MRREYGQPCSLAFALDSVGERWSLLIVRELTAGPAALLATSPAPSAAPRPTSSPSDCATSRPTASSTAVELPAPAAATVYELTELGRGLERPLIELARWGMELQKADDVVGLAPSSLPNALRVILRPPAAASFDLGLRTDGESYALRARDGWIAGSRGDVGDPDLTLSGTPIEVVAAVVSGPAGVPGVEIEGDAALLDRLRDDGRHPRAPARGSADAGRVRRAAPGRRLPTDPYCPCGLGRMTCLVIPLPTLQSSRGGVWRFLHGFFLGLGLGAGRGCSRPRAPAVCAPARSRRPQYPTAHQVVGERGDHRPGGVGAGLAGRAVGERLVL